MSRPARWRQRLESIASVGQHRRLRPLTPTGPTTGLLDGREVAVFCANDYLGLARHPVVVESAHGGGAGASRLISGDRPIHHQLEDEVSTWLGREVVLFGSGYMANLGVLPALFGRDDRVGSDALNHASLIDGLRLSRAQVQILPHNQLETSDLDGLVIESLYSMDGDTACFAQIHPDPLLVVDEAHAIGCLGPEGRGLTTASGARVDVMMGTFGKAFGAAGAFVAGHPPLRELLVNTARTLIFSTALPEPVAAAALAGVRFARRNPELRERLAAHTQYFREALRQLGWRPLGVAHIVPLVVGPDAMRLSARLLDHGYFVAGIRPPTVPPGTERLRITLSAAHTRDQIDGLLEALGPMDRSAA